ncbi:MAG: DEAD/DEAH box helicase, partial [Gammaproteobacteria bacterium]
MITLRDYQINAKSAVSKDFTDGYNAVGCSLPTGVGKSKIMASMAADIYARGRRSVTLLHRDTLVDQFARHLAEVIPARAIGTVKASSNDVNAPVIVASIHTLRGMERLGQLTPPDLTIVDEAHVSVSDSYLQYFGYCDIRPGGQRHAVGFTATWMRSDRRGLGDVWQKISYQRTLKWAVKRGYLVPPVTYQLGGNLDLTGVRVAKDGDYTDRALEQVVMVEDLRATVVDGYLRMARGRSAVLFAPTTASARYFGDALREAGVRVGEIFAGTTRAARKYNFAQFDAGNIDVLITCTALAEGWDAPRCDAVLCLRPTKSAGMFVQQVGRGLRPWPGKMDCLVLDFVGITDDNSIVAH